MQAGGHQAMDTTGAGPGGPPDPGGRAGPRGLLRPRGPGDPHQDDPDRGRGDGAGIGGGGRHPEDRGLRRAAGGEHHRARPCSAASRSSRSTVRRWWRPRRSSSPRGGWSSRVDQHLRAKRGGRLGPRSRRPAAGSAYWDITDEQIARLARDRRRHQDLDPGLVRSTGSCWRRRWSRASGSCPASRSTAWPTSPRSGWRARCSSRDLAFDLRRERAGPHRGGRLPRRARHGPGRASSTRPSTSPEPDQPGPGDGSQPGAQAQARDVRDAVRGGRGGPGGDCGARGRPSWSPASATWSSSEAATDCSCLGTVVLGNRAGDQARGALEGLAEGEIIS